MLCSKSSLFNHRVGQLLHKPQVLLIWLGALIIFVGGGLSLSDRRFRVGAPRPARESVAVEPAEQPA